MDQHQGTHRIQGGPKDSFSNLIDFCNTITPPNWHATTEVPGFVFGGPGTLNILMKPIDHFIDGWFYAFKKGFMSFHRVSEYLGQNDRARLSLKKYGDHLVGESEIWLYPDGCGFFGDNLYTATVHELAHVAVDRWCAYQQKAYRSACPVQRPGRPLHHGQVFCKAFEAIIRRVDCLWENPTPLVQPLRLELAAYQSALDGRVALSAR